MRQGLSSRRCLKCKEALFYFSRDCNRELACNIGCQEGLSLRRGGERGRDSCSSGAFIGLCVTSCCCCSTLCFCISTCGRSSKRYVRATWTEFLVHGLIFSTVVVFLVKGNTTVDVFGLKNRGRCFCDKSLAVVA